jgi:hypothetical protein
MFGPIQDRIGRSLIVLFLIKPLIDLGYFLSFSVGPIRIAPTTVAGLLICLYFATFRFQGSRFMPPYIRVFEAFLAVNLVSIVLGAFISERFLLNAMFVLALKILNSYFLFFAAYKAATAHQYQDFTPFVRAIVLGSAAAVVLNLAAIGLNVENPASDYSSDLGDRERGLYYDAGVLANLAFFNLIFAVFWVHMQRRKSILWLLVIGLLIMADLYLISASKSRSVMIELAVFAIIYTWLFQKRFGKILAPLAGAAIITVAIVAFDINTEDLFVRFEGDIDALGSEGPGVGTVNSGVGEKVTLGKYEAIGGNRGGLWANALTEIFQRSTIEILLGDFFATSLAHSDYIDVLGRNGIIGIILYLTLLVGLFRDTFAAIRRPMNDRERVVHFVAFILLICYMLYSMPFRPLSYTTSAWYMWLMLAFSLALTTNMRYQRAVARSERLSEPDTGGRDARERTPAVVPRPRPG